MFGWDMYADVGLAAAVPKTASVSAFTSWARVHGCWSEYPSIGAWVNIDDGGHTETVTGFDATYVYTKGGNSIQAGAADSGQGNGVFSHRTERRSSRVTGYLAPVFPDGICPPTADPADPRGGKPAAAYRWAPAVSAVSAVMPQFPGRGYFLLGATSDHALLLQTWLQRGQWGPPYRVGPSRTMTALDLAKVKALQEHPGPGRRRPGRRRRGALRQQPPGLRQRQPVPVADHTEGATAHAVAPSASPLWNPLTMATHRFTEIPADALAVIEAHTGPVLKAESASTGLNSEVAARIHTASGALFVKGLRLEHPRAWTQDREAAIAPHVAPLAPALFWHTQRDGWDLLGFEDLDGPHADYAPGSLHLAPVADAMQTLAGMPLPDLPLRTMSDRLRAYAGDDADLFTGDQLLHTDWNPHNVLVVDDRARLVDWAWAARGAGWIDPALWVIWLVATGHTADQAERMAARHTALADAPTRSLDAFARAQSGMWDEIAGDRPDEWTATMQAAAAAWHQHRCD